MSGFQSPNYTQTPNDLFDKLLPDMGLAELKVVLCIVRHTFGYHKDDVKMSIRAISRFTGLTAKSVMEGAIQAETHGLIERKLDGNKTTVWSATVSVIPTNTRRNTRYNAHVLPSKTLSRVKEIKENNIESEIFSILENLLGGLSTDTPRYVDTWLEKHKPEWIFKAIQEAKDKGARSVKYIDKVLISWEANGYPKTREEKVKAAKKADPRNQQASLIRTIS